MGEARHTLGALRAPSVPGFSPTESPTQWPPEGPRRVSAKRGYEQEMVCNTTFDDSFRILDLLMVGFAEGCSSVLLIRSYDIWTESKDCSGERKPRISHSMLAEPVLLECWTTQCGEKKRHCGLQFDCNEKLRIVLMNMQNHFT